MVVYRLLDRQIRFLFRLEYQPILPRLDRALNPVSLRQVAVARHEAVNGPVGFRNVDFGYALSPLTNGHLLALCQLDRGF